MATANNTIKTRTQVKRDTEANWLEHPILPLAGELIVYLPDANHPYTRLKIGDGNTNSTNLPFIDAGTLNGTEHFIVKCANFNSFPSPGNVDCLYVDLATSGLYYYSPSNGYIPLGQTGITVTSTTIHDVVHWGAGSATTASVANGVLSIRNGVAPQLLMQEVSVVKNVVASGGGN